MQGLRLVGRLVGAIAEKAKRAAANQAMLPDFKNYRRSTIVFQIRHFLTLLPLAA
jgi:hypothetical protein